MAAFFAKQHSAERFVKSYILPPFAVDCNNWMGIFLGVMDAECLTVVQAQPVLYNKSENIFLPFPP